MDYILICIVGFIAGYLSFIAGYFYAFYKQDNYYRSAINMAYKKGIARGQATGLKTGLQSESKG